jgi:hypothetical protein
MAVREGGQHGYDVCKSDAKDTDEVEEAISIKHLQHGTQFN